MGMTRADLGHGRRRPKGHEARPAPRRMAGNFVFLSLAEVACRGASVAVTLSLAKRLGTAGYGRVEFAFNIVFWLVLLIRDGFEVISSREIARHPRLIRPLVNRLLAVKPVIAASLFAATAAAGWIMLPGTTEKVILILYGLMLFTASLGFDFVYRATERMGVVALSMCCRAACYAIGVWFWVADSSRIVWVPVCLVAGEIAGISIVWYKFSKTYGIPRPTWRLKFLKVFLRRGRPVLLIQVSQTVLASVDMMVVGLLSPWHDVGVYGAPHRMVTAVLTFGLIFQQVVFPSLARTWREEADRGRRSFDALLRVLVLALCPIAIGTVVLAGPIVRTLLPPDYAEASLLLAIGIWRAPLLSLAFLLQMMLIALNRETSGVRFLVGGAICSGPIVALLLKAFGLPGASAGIVLIALGLVILAHLRLARENRPPSKHYHLGKPLIASGAMAIVCLCLRDRHVSIPIVAGAVAYLVVILAIGGIKAEDLRAIGGRGRDSAGEPTPNRFARVVRRSRA